MDSSKKSKIVEFHKNNPTLSKVIIGSTGLLRKITGKESAYKQQEIEKKIEQASLESILSSNHSLKKSTTSLLINKAASLDFNYSGGLRQRLVDKLKSDADLKKSMAKRAILSESPMKLTESPMKLTESPMKLTESPRKMSSSNSSKKSSASSKKSSASSKKSSASSKKSSASSKKSSYEPGPLKPQRNKTYYLPY